MLTSHILQQTCPFLDGEDLRRGLFSDGKDLRRGLFLDGEDKFDSNPSNLPDLPILSAARLLILEREFSCLKRKQEGAEVNQIKLEDGSV